MATDGAIIEIVDRQLLGADVALNVYHYRLGSGLLTIDASTIAEVWWLDCNAVIRGGQHQDLLHIRVTARNLDNPADYGEYIVPEAERAGEVTGGQVMPRQDAYGITFRPAEPTVRPGSKRLAGVAELYSGQWGLLDPTILAVLEDYGAHMSSQINSLTPAFVLQPVIVGLPNDDRPERVEADIVSYVVNPYVTTQNTRKVGRGA